MMSAPGRKSPAHHLGIHRHVFFLLQIYLYESQIARRLIRIHRVLMAHAGASGLFTFFIFVLNLAPPSSPGPPLVRWPSVLQLFSSVKETAHSWTPPPPSHDAPQMVTSLPLLSPSAAMTRL